MGPFQPICHAFIMSVTPLQRWYQGWLEASSAGTNSNGSLTTLMTCFSTQPNSVTTDIVLWFSCSSHLGSLVSFLAMNTITRRSGRTSKPHKLFSYLLPPLPSSKRSRFLLNSISTINKCSACYSHVMWMDKDKFRLQLYTFSIDMGSRILHLNIYTNVNMDNISIQESPQTIEQIQVNGHTQKKSWD